MKVPDLAPVVFGEKVSRMSMCRIGQWPSWRRWLMLSSMLVNTSAGSSSYLKKVIVGSSTSLWPLFELRGILNCGGKVGCHNWLR